ncbi:MAG: fumarylacetoacetate hydrolase family protein [Motiliproteus sp.]
MSMTQNEIEIAAELLCSAHDNHCQLPSSVLLNTRPPGSFDEAYAIQDAVAQRRWMEKGGRTHTWKTGAPNNETAPYAAPIPPNVVYDGPAELRSNRFHIIGIESELAYRFARDLPPKDTPYTAEEIIDAVAGVYVAIEVVDTRLKDWQQAGKLWQLADNQITGALVMGSGRKDWNCLDPVQQSVELLVDGELLVSNQGSHPLGDPRPLVTWIINHCAGRNGGVKEGDIVTTGSWTGLEFIEPGSHVVARFPGIGEATVSFPT